MKNFLLTLILLFHSLVYASQECINIAETMAPAFIKTLVEDYRPLMCSDNIFMAAKNLKAQGVDISDAQVVVIHDIGVPYIGIHPLSPKLTYKDKVYKPSAWSFHVFFVVRGLVFDLDYTDIPQAIGLENYLRLMWDSEELSHMVVQIKNFSEYTVKDTFGVFPNQDIYPALNIMTKLTNTSCSAEFGIVLAP